MRIVDLKALQLNKVESTRYKQDMDSKVRRSFVNMTKWYNKNYSLLSQQSKDSFRRIYSLWQENKPILEIYNSTASDNIILSKEIFAQCVEWIQYTNDLSEYYYEEYLQHCTHK